METTQHPSAAAARPFVTTNWSVVTAAANPLAARAEALETLCRTYWPPIYTYIRRRGHTAHEAQDLTQSFFAALLSRKGLDSVQPAEGKFRSFLLASVNNFLANHFDWHQAAKRGGGQPILSLDEAMAQDESLMQVASNDSPEIALDRRWALTVLSRALQGLRTEFVAAGREHVLDRLKQYLEEEVRPGDYRALATELGLTPGAVAVAVHRLRQRYRELVRREIAQTVASAEEIEAEVSHLLRVLSS